MLKYNLATLLDSLPKSEYKKARKELPELTGYTWKTIRYHWTEIKLSDKKSIPSEPLDKICNYFNVERSWLVNYKV